MSVSSRDTSCARCGGHLANDNHSGRCAACQRAERNRIVAPPEVPVTFWGHDPLRQALAERHLGRVVRAYRHHPYHGHQPLSQKTVAGWLGITQAQLSRVENGSPVVHLDRLIHWARVLRIPSHALWFQLPPGQQSIAPAALTADAEETGLPLIRALRSADRQIGGKNLYGAVLAHLAVFSVPAERSPSLPQHALAAVASLHEMAGWMAHDSGASAAGRRHFHNALALACEGHDQRLVGQIRGSLSHLACHEGDAETAISHASAGLSVVVGDHADARIRARLLALQARGFSVAGRAQECHTALRLAEVALSQGVAVSSEWLSPFDRTSFSIESARCLLRLGDLTAALRVLDDIPVDRPTARVRSQALARLLLVTALVGQARIDEACLITHQAIDHTDGLGSAIVLDQLRQLAWLLRSHLGRCAAVPPLLDRLRDTFRERTWVTLPMPTS